MSQATTRVLALLELLQARPGLRAGELADRLGVDERTVRRYTSALAELGVPVTAERGRYGGYRLRPGYKLPPLMLTDDEAVAVVLGLLAGLRLGLSTASPGTAGLAVESALAKIERVLPEALRERVQAVRDSLGFTQPAREATAPRTGHLLALGEAVRDNRRVRLRYRTWRGTDLERELDPYGLVFHAGRWYVAGLDRHADQLRSLRLDRIATVRPTGDTFTPPADFDAVGHVTRSLANVPYRHEVEVLLHTTSEEASRRIPPSVGSLHAADGGVLLRARADRLDGMAQMLAGLGWPFTIRRPEELRAAVVDFAARLTAFAGNGTA